MDMMSSLLLVLLGLAVGAFGTLIGAGGGFILVPVLLLLYPHMQPELITSISLAVVFLNATSGSIAYARMKRIDYKSAALFALATLPGSVIGAIITGYISRHLFDMILGVLLVAISIFLFIKPHQGALAGNFEDHRLTNRTITDREGEEYHYSFNKWIGVALSFFVGFLSSLLGIGGGIIHVPALTSLLNFPIHIATATSHFILAVMSLAGTIVHIIQGNLKEGWLMALLIGTGVIIGAQIGAFFSHRVQGNFIVRALAAALLLVGIRLLFF